jgi:hypothetical protein
VGTEPSADAGARPNGGLPISADIGSPVVESISKKPCRGLIDEVTVHPRALSAEEPPERLK